MKNGRSVVAGFVGSAALTLGIAVVACSSSASGVGGADSGADGGTDVTTGGGGTKSCTTDSQCTPPPTIPANCATGSCNSATGTCTFKSNDADGDQHTAANCKATNGVVVQVGDDCDDTDKSLYPGHAEACTTSGGGGVVRFPNGGATGACKAGLLSCQAGGVVSACTGEVPACPQNETCLSGQCTGQCGPGQTQCSGDTAVQTCEANGTWGQPVACTGGACLQTDAGAGSGGASCGGVCSPGQTRCQPGENAVQTCSSSGAWGAPAACTGTSTCLQAQADAGTVASCGGTCGPGNTTCVGNSVVSCQANGAYDGGTTVPCSPQACVQTGTAGSPSAMCEGSCVPGAVAACGPCLKGTETCTASGNAGICTGDLPVSAACGVSPSCTNGTSHCGEPCVGETANYGAGCGSCGGTVTCGGGCSISTPSGWNQGCGSCGGVTLCSGACSKATPPNYGSACGNSPQCQGTYDCNGNCTDTQTYQCPSGWASSAPPNGVSGPCWLAEAPFANTDMSDYGEPNPHVEYTFAGPNFNTMNGNIKFCFNPAFGINSGSCNSDNGAALQISCNDGSGITLSNAQLDNPGPYCFNGNAVGATCTVSSLEGWTQSLHSACHRQLANQTWYAGGVGETCR